MSAPEIRPLEAGRFRRTWRDRPFVWSTWVARQLALLSTCPWAPWFRAQYTHKAHPIDFDLDDWLRRRDELLGETLQRIRDVQGDNLTSWIEGKDCEWQVPGRAGVFAGRPDLITLTKDEGISVLRCFPDDPENPERAEHLEDLRIHMFVRSLKDPKRPVPCGYAVYPTRQVVVEPETVTDDWKRRLREVLTMLYGRRIPPAQAPHPETCAMCTVGPEHCDARIDKGESWDSIGEHPGDLEDHPPEHEITGY